MENLTPGTVWTVVLAVASAVVLLSNAAEKVAKIVQAAKAPNEEQNARLDKMEANLKKDDKRLDTIEEGNRASQRALLALLDHSIDGNNIKQMQHAKEELQNHLINR